MADIRLTYFQKFLSILTFYGWTTNLTAEEYTNSKTFYEVFCPKGHSRKKNLEKLNHQMKHGGDKMVCLECKDGSYDPSTKTQIERRKNVFAEFLTCATERGFQMLSTWEDYFTNLTLLKLICPAGHHLETNWSNFQQVERGCKQCSYDEKLKLSYEDVKKYIESRGCELLSKTFRSVDKILKIKCHCGAILHKTFHQFRQTKGACKLCSQSTIFYFPSGREEYVQGYEHRTIEEFLAGPHDVYGHIEEQDMVIGEEVIPPVDYFFDGKMRKTYPDLWIPSKNLYIETKSVHNYLRAKEQNDAKFEAICLAGFNFECWFYDDRGEKGWMMKVVYELFEDSVLITEGGWEYCLGGGIRGCIDRKRI